GRGPARRRRGAARPSGRVARSRAAHGARPDAGDHRVGAVAGLNARSNRGGTMKLVQSLSALFGAGALLLAAATSTAAPRNYTFTGKFTSNRGTLINLPVVGDTPCAGVGLSNLRIMSGPGLTGPHTILSMTGMSMQPNPTPTMHPFSQFANGDKRDYGCVGFNPGIKVITTGAGAGGQFVLPDHVLRQPFPTMTTAVHIPNATPA